MSDLYIYADETSDYLREALEKAEAVKKAASQFVEDDSTPNAAEASEIRSAAHDLKSLIADAQTAADTTWDQVNRL
jgi:hypothetical protein